jgi:hypothetical protein
MYSDREFHGLSLGLKRVGASMGVGEVRLMGERSTDTEFILTQTCACTQSYPKPYCNLYRHFCFRHFET